MTRRQEIIFRFTIPADPSSIPRWSDRSSVTGTTPNSNHDNNHGAGNLVPSDYFTVCAFGTEYLVEYPCGIAGFRRPCTNRLGYISLPTYYDVPMVEHLGKRRYSVHVPKEVLSSGESEFYVSLPPDDCDHATCTTTTTTGNGNRSTPPLPSPPPFQVRLVLPDSRPTMLEFDAPEDTLSAGAMPCRWKKAPSPKTTFQVMIPPPSPRSTTMNADTTFGLVPHTHHSTPAATWDQTHYILTYLGSLPAIVTRPPPDASSSDASSLITVTIPLGAVPNYSTKTVQNHAIQYQEPLQEAEIGGKDGEWHRLYHATTNRLQWFYFHLSSSSSSSSSSPSELQLAKQTPKAWVCHLMNLETTLSSDHGLPSTSTSSSLFVSRKPAKRTPWSLVPIHQAQGLPLTIYSHDRKTLDGDPQTIGSFWDLVTLRDRQRQRTLVQWRLKLQGEAARGGNGIGNGNASSNTSAVAAATASLTMPNLQFDSSEDIGQVLQTICEAVETQLVSPSQLRGPWGIPGPWCCRNTCSFSSSSSASSSSWTASWMSSLAQWIVQYELQPTPGNPQRWEFCSTSRLGPSHLLGILVGKSLVQGNSPIFSSQVQLATYLYKYLLHWPIQEDDYRQVVVVPESTGETTNDSMASCQKENEWDQVLYDRLFDSTKDPISSFLDGVFLIVPLSFMMVFRTLQELEECLVEKCMEQPVLPKNVP